MLGNFMTWSGADIRKPWPCRLRSFGARPISGRVVLAVLLLGFVAFAPRRSMAEGDAERGAKAFQACAACHSLRPDLNMTGPSLAGVWNRQAGSLANFDRYSPAVKRSGVTWNTQSLDVWLRDPVAFIPDNWMTFSGIADDRTRTDLIAFLRAVGETGNGNPAVAVPSAYTEALTDLKSLPPAQQVKAIRNCRDSYFVTMEDGKMRAFWDQSLRLETDGSTSGPLPGKPVILPAGMFGDRALVIFAAFEEISSFIKHQC
jgi:cytochrome c